MAPPETPPPTGTSTQIIKTHRRGDPNDAGGAPPAVRGFQSGAHHLRVARAVERVVDAPLGQLPGNVLLHRFVEFFAVDAVRGAQRNGHFEFVRIDVHGDDFRCARHFGALDDGEALLQTHRKSGWRVTEKVRE